MEQFPELRDILEPSSLALEDIELIEDLIVFDGFVFGCRIHALEHEEILLDILDSEIDRRAVGGHEGIRIGFQHLGKQIDHHEKDEYAEDGDRGLIFILEYEFLELAEKGMLIDLHGELFMGLDCRSRDEIMEDESERFLVQSRIEELLEEIDQMGVFRSQDAFHLLEIAIVKDIGYLGSYIQQLIMALYIAFHEIREQIYLSFVIERIGQ